MLDKLIASENSDKMYEAWTEYRNALTNDVKESVLHLLIKRKLIKEKKKRLENNYDINAAVDEFVNENGRRPVLAIWGAGGCNDIDIKELSNYFSLVLIDRDVEAIENARKKYEINNCACIDLKFFDITYDEYKMIEALLQDNCSYEDVKNYILEIVDSMSVLNTSSVPRFDYSIAAGLASQLLSRLNALFEEYKVREKYDSLLKELSDIAVDKMLKAIEATTESLIILGYEKNVYDNSIENDTIKMMIEAYNEEGASELNPGCSIVGNDRLEKIVINEITSTNKYNLINKKTELWPFTSNKKYMMNILALECL